MTLVAHVTRGWMPWAHGAFPYQTACAFLVGLLGAVVAFLGVVHLKQAQTTVNPMTPLASSALVCRGVYRLSRHPVYLGFVLLLLGLAIFLGSLVALLLVPGFMFYLQRYQIEPEEKTLLALFGTDYVAYQHKVGRWLCVGSGPRRK